MILQEIRSYTIEVWPLNYRFIIHGETIAITFPFLKQVNSKNAKLEV